MKVNDIMSGQVIWIDGAESVSAAARLMKQYNIGAVPVCDGKKRLRGIVTDRDIVIRCISEGLNPLAVPVGDIMSRGIVTAAPEDEVGSAAKTMRTDQVRRLPVLKDGQLVGMVTLCDMARSMGCDMEASETLTEVSANLRRK